MGYYTDYTLNVSGTRRDRSKALVTGAEIQRDLLDRVCAAVEKMDVGLEGDPDMGWYVNAKWYDHEKDTLALSTEFPTILFILHGAGEDEDDRWYTITSMVCNSMLRPKSTTMISRNRSWSHNVPALPGGSEHGHKESDCRLS